jgi:hypothetical protein
LRHDYFLGSIHGAGYGTQSCSGNGYRNFSRGFHEIGLGKYCHPIGFCGFRDRQSVDGSGFYRGAAAIFSERQRGHEYCGDVDTFGLWMQRLCLRNDLQHRALHCAFLRTFVTNR